MTRKVSDEYLHALSDFRYELRKFLRASEELCRSEGVTPLQYQMLLQTRAHPGRTWILVGELANRLQSAPHGVVALVSRGEASGLVVRRIDPGNRRQVQVHVTGKGERLLQRLAAGHVHELSALYKVLRKMGMRKDGLP
jgi:DNA-binding MarR family transcriptional regulator